MARELMVAGPTPNPDHLIVEYQECIENMRHWDNVGWGSMAFSLGFVSVIVQFMAQNRTAADAMFAATVVFIGYSVFLSRVLIKITEPRYRRAIEIERALGLHQYELVDEWKQRERIMGKFQKPFFFISTAYVFLLVAVAMVYAAIKLGWA